MKIKIRKTNVVLFCILFLFVFAPPIVPNIHYILAVVGGGWVLINHNFYLKLFSVSAMKLWCKAMVGLSFYVLLITLGNIIYGDVVKPSHYVSLYNRYLSVVIIIIPVSLIVIGYCVQKNVSCERIMEIFITVGLLQGIMDLTAYFIPKIRNAFLWFLVNFSDSSLYSNAWHLKRRVYGLAYCLTDEFGWGMGILSGIALIYGIEKNKKYIIYSLIIVLGGIINARTTLIIYILAPMVILIFYIINRRGKKFVKYVSIAGFVLTMLIVALKKFVNQSSMSYQWILSGINDLVNILFGKSQSVVSTDFSSKLFTDTSLELPDLLRAIIGTGHSRYQASGYNHTDCGYINDIWFVGILGALFLYSIIIFMVWKIYQNATSDLIKMLSIFLIASFIVFNIKAGAICYNVGPAVFFSILFILDNYVNGRVVRKM